MSSKTWLRLNRYWVFLLGIAAVLGGAVVLLSITWLPTAAVQVSGLVRDDEYHLSSLEAEFDSARLRGRQLKAQLDSLIVVSGAATTEVAVISLIRECCRKAGVTVIGYDQLLPAATASVPITSFRIVAEGSYDQSAAAVSLLYRSSARLQIESLSLERAAIAHKKLICTFLVVTSREE